MKIFKIILLFIFFAVTGCAVYNSENTEMVSTENVRNLSFSNSNEEVLKANVTIYNNNYNSFLGYKYKKHNTYGSGFIYKSDENYYYILTNNHVVSFDYNYDHNELIVEDYYGNEYKAIVEYKDINYDLAAVRIEKLADLKVLDISNEDLKVRDSVRTMGNPDSNKNVLSQGVISCFNNIDLNNDKAKVNFEVIVHSAYIKGGSSGGALLNSDNEVIGVTFAGVFDNNGEFITGYAIPVVRINEFLSKYI